MNDDVAGAAAAVRDAQHIVVLSGAGISTDSGIPDFRGPAGVWTRNPAAERAATLEHYLADADLRRAAWRNRLDHRMWSAEPNDGHRAVTVLHHQRRLRAVITQNVDGLHQAAGVPGDKVIEVHGTATRTMCWECGDRRPMGQALDRVRCGEDDPPCLVCGGILKSDTISFGQMLVPDVIAAAFDAVERCDLLLAVGSTLQVYPVAAVVPAARQAGATIVVVNHQPTGMDDVADAVLRGSISEVLPRLVLR